MPVSPALDTQPSQAPIATPRRGKTARDTGVKVLAFLVLISSFSLAIAYWQQQQAEPRRNHDAALALHSQTLFDQLQTDLQIADRLLHTLDLAAEFQTLDANEGFKRIAKTASLGLRNLHPLALAHTRPLASAPNIFRTGEALDSSAVEWARKLPALQTLIQDAAKQTSRTGKLTLVGPVLVGKLRVLALAQAGHEGDAYVLLINQDRWLSSAASKHANWLSAALRISSTNTPQPRTGTLIFDEISPHVSLLVTPGPLDQNPVSVLGASGIALFGAMIAGLMLLLGSRGSAAANTANLADQALSESDARLQRALQLTEDGVWEYSLSNHQLYVSQQALQLIARQQTETINEEMPVPTRGALLKLLPREWRREVLATIASTIGSSKTRELRFPVSDAFLSTRWMKLRVRSTTSPDGGPQIITGSLSDISEEMSHESAQDRYHALLMRVLDAMPIPVSVKTADQKVVMLNERYTHRLMGVLETVTGRSNDINRPGSPNRRIGDSFAERMEELDQLAIATGEPQIAHEWITLVDGSELYLRITRVLCDGLNGEPIVLSTYEDLTELQSQAQQQTALREYFEKVFDHLPSPTYIKDANHRYILTNQAHARANKTTKEDMLGKRSADYAPDQAEEVEAAERHLLETESDEIHEKEYVLNSGKMEGNTIIRKVRITNPDGNSVLLGTSTNITALREAEADLRQQAAQQSRLRKFLQDVFDAVPHPLFVKDRQHRYIMTNRAHSESVGASNDKILGKRSADFVTEDVATVIERAEEALFSGPASASMESEYVLQHRNGHKRHTLIRKALCTTAQGDTVIVGVNTDITLLREAEARLRQQREAEI